MNDNIEPEPGALFQIEGPDEDGCMWLLKPDGRTIERQNLGQVAKVGTAMSRLGLLACSEDA